MTNSGFMKSYSDIELVDLFKSTNNQDFLAELLIRHNDVIYRTALRIMKNPADAEDILQTVYCIAVKDLNGFKGTGSVIGWLLQLVIHTCYNQKKSQKSRLNREKKTMHEKQQRNLSENNETIEIIEKHLDRLPEIYKAPIILQIMEGLTIREVSEVLKVPEKTIRSQIDRGLDKLKKSLQTVGITASIVSLGEMIQTIHKPQVPEVYKSLDYINGILKSRAILTSKVNGIALKKSFLSISIIASLSAILFLFYFVNKIFVNKKNNEIKYTNSSLLPNEASTVNNSIVSNQEILNSIKKLSDNTWLKLPKIKVAGNLGWLDQSSEGRTRGPIGASYISTAVYAPERKRAICISSLAAVWEYDLANNTWACLRAGETSGIQKNTESWFRENTMMAEDGFITTKNGGPVSIGDVFSQVCYDPDRQLVLWVNSMPRAVDYSVDMDNPNNVIAKGLNLNFEEFKNKLCKDGIYIWEFSPDKQAFTRREFVVNLKGLGNTTGGRQEDGLLKYLPGQKTIFFNGLLRDLQTGKWYKSNSNELPNFQRTNGEYDQATGQFFLHDQIKGVYSLSKDKNWNLVNPTSIAGGFQYDAFAKEFISMIWENKNLKQIMVFNPINKEWKSMPDALGDIPIDGELSINWYDPSQNVHVLYNSKDIYVYRYKNRP